MKKYATMEQYRTLSEYMLGEKPYLDPSLSFRKLCSRLGLPYRRLNNTLLAELGLDGDEIMENFRAGEVGKLLLLHN